MNLPNGVESDLLGPLHQVTTLLNDGKPNNDNGVCNKLNEFLVHVQDQLAATDITQAQASLLSVFAQAIIDQNCQ